MQLNRKNVLLLDCDNVLTLSTYSIRCCYWENIFTGKWRYYV